jgi:hypothetical protein
MNKDNLLKFHGKFTDLIPAGFKFQKLFARNYRQYCLDVVEHCECIRVWQAHGGYIEIDDWFSATKSVVEAVINGNFKWHSYEKIPGFPFHCTSLGFTIVRETQKIVPWVREIHDHMYNFIQLEKAGKTEEEITVALHKLEDTYRVKRISQNMIAAIKDMHAKGWIKV